MPKIKVPRRATFVRFLLHPAGKTLAGVLLLGFLGFLGSFTYYYVKYSRLIEQKFREGPFAATSKIFAAPKVVATGEPFTADELVQRLRRAGYGESKANRVGWYNVRPDAVEIFPGPDSFNGQDACVIKLAGGQISEIVSVQDHTSRPLYSLEPELITNLSDRNRQKRRLVRFEDLPKILVEAVISAEDKRFFQHAGFDPFRILKAIYVDVKEGRKEQGASTLSMQLARSFWLDQDKRWSRKAAEVMITLQLEQKLTKQEIFELYANQVDLGRRGTFAIHGFGEAAQAYLGKDLRQVSLPEAAMLAGLIQRPSYFNPFRHPERMKNRRNVILLLMRENGFVNDREYALAREAPLNLAQAAADSAAAPYFVDLVNDELQNELENHDFQSSIYRVYTTLDLDLQRAAGDAIKAGMQNVDEQLKRQRRHRGQSFPDAQVALVALDPRTGEVKALAGGRNYGMSQLNHVLAKRQPGSVFKPFVYAAAMNTGLQSGAKLLTPLTTIQDEPTTFWYDGKPYQPNNFHEEWHGLVTLRQAIAKSMNVPTVRVAEMVGYDTVADLAKSAGMNEDLQPTPAIALGAYEVTPVEIAGAYTVFANEGIWLKPTWVRQVRQQDGAVLYAAKPESKQVLDKRVNYMMVNLMEEVLRSGTGASVRARGFVVPAAGKTGTSHDGWFAGFTSELLCVVWVGFDDNRELNLEGAKSALPIWTEFMKRALELREYRRVRPFEAPDGIVSIAVDPLSGQLATSRCPASRQEVFIAGTQPIESCRLHGGDAGLTHVAGWDTKPPDADKPVESAQAPRAVARRAATPVASPPPPAAPKEPEKKKGIFRRLLDVFK